jgi:hypothetical protein
MTLLITIFIVIRNILILILERSPRIEVVEEVVEVLNVLLGAVLVAKLGNWLNTRKSTFGLEDIAPQLIELALLKLLLGWGFNICVFIDGVVLTALNRIKENFGGLLNTLEEAVIFGTAGCCFLIGMVAKNLLAVGTLNLLLASSETVLRKAQDSVMILTLPNVLAISTHRSNSLTFQSLASRESIIGSSGSLISPESSSSTFLTFS